jgi:diguanylate cyclase (GGDEF)-like protein
VNKRTHRSGIAIIAEDEELGRLLLCEAAKNAGLTPVVFDNGARALEAALACDAEIILLDVDMPGLDGYTVCRRIRESGAQREVPIVMVTGHEDTVAINRAFDAGATDFISKPVNWALLPHRLGYILRNAASVRALADREAKVRALVDAIPDALWVVSPTGEARWSPNSSASRFTDAGVAPSNLQASLPAAVVPEVLSAIALTARDRAPRSLDFRETPRSGKARSAALRFSICDGGDVLVVRQDTSERTAAAAHIEKLAYSDLLTGLPNRQRCIEVAQRLLEGSSQTQAGVGFIYLDLNGFKRVNDSFGHSVGDVVLVRVAEILSAVVAQFAAHCAHISLARLGGDEFVILIQQQAPRAQALKLAAACCAALREPIHWNQLEFFATPSIGVAIYPDDGNDVETLLKHADTAMYQSKTSGTATVSEYSASMSARLRDWLELESRLRNAVREGLLSLHFQPKLRVSDNALAGVEALVRWCDSEYGDIPPSRFVPIAEETGLIIDMGAWLVRAACKQLRTWLDRGIEIPIAINLSGKELIFGDPAGVIETELARLGIPAALLEIEITESVFVSDATAGVSTIDRLKRIGCRIALDDFGTGYSSLAYLSRFPPDRLKIDRSFIQNVDRSESDAAIVNSIMSLARSLNLAVIAEGVERPQQVEWLRSRGCDEMQGFLLSRPLTAQILERDFLRAPPAHTALISIPPEGRSTKIG